MRQGDLSKAPPFGAGLAVGGALGKSMNATRSSWRVESGCSEARLASASSAGWNLGFKRSTSRYSAIASLVRPCRRWMFARL